MPALTVDPGYFDDALRIVSTALHGRINQTAQTSLANDILCVAAGLRSAALIEQLYLNPNDVERIQSMFHHTTRFNHLDLLKIGDDHVFIIYRTLLLQDINEYLSESEQGLHRVFVNVDCLSPQPEILPGRRYEPLDKYLRDTLLPDLQTRIQCWDQAELCYLPLLAPDYVHDQGDSIMTTAEDESKARSTPAETDAEAAGDGSLGLSMVTLSGWLLGYPVIYVLPTTTRMMARKRAAKALKRRERALNQQRKAAARLLHHHQLQQQRMGADQVLPTAVPMGHDRADCSTCVDDGNMSDDEGDGDMYTKEGAGRDIQANELDDEAEEEEEEDNSHNSLANRLLVLTQVNLSANEAIHGLQDYCLFSFSYPSALLDRYSAPGAVGAEIASSAQSSTTSASPLWFSGGDDSSTAACLEMNPFETSLLANSSSSHNAAGSPYSTTMPGALPTTPPSILTSTGAASVPSSSYSSRPATTIAPAAPVVPSIILSPSPTYLAPPMHQHHSQRRRTRSRSRHPFDMTPDSSSDDPSSASSYSTHSPMQGHSHSHHLRSHRNARRGSSPTPVPGLGMDPIQQYRLHRSQEPLFQQHRQHILPHHHHQRGLRHRRQEQEKEDHDLLPPSHPDICAAGRSLLEVLHARFGKQGVWKTWQIGQQTVTLPVVAL